MPYDSAHDLPSSIEFDKELRAYEALAHMFKPELLPALQEPATENISYRDLLDDFQQLLGPRNWITTGSLRLDTMKQIVAEHGNDAEAAERALIEAYKADRYLSFNIKRLWRHEAMRPRIPLLELARVDYEAGRYYAVIHVVLSVVEGFVLDVDKRNRIGVFSKKDDDRPMEAWDSPVGLRYGIESVRKVITRSFKKLVTEPTTELYRNGIVHGMLTDYNNDVVATKAWNFLFAVTEWADSLEERRREEAKAPPPSLLDLARQHSEVVRRREAIEAFTPYEYSIDEPEFAAHEAVLATQRFLELWNKKNYGGMAQMMTLGFGGVAPLTVKNDYREHQLESFKLQRVEHYGDCCTSR